MALLTKKWEHSDLKRSYQEGETADKTIFAEQRTNVLLVSGDHYANQKSKYFERVRDSKGLADEQRLRLVENHTHKIMRAYSNSITAYCPGVSPKPQSEKSLQDVKGAELHAKVQKYAKNKYRFKEKVRDWSDDFNIIGEVGCKIFFDPMMGKQIGWEPEVDEKGAPVYETDADGNPVLHPETMQPQPKASERPVYAGDFVFERYYGFNLIRESSCKEMDESPVLHLRKMVEITKMQARYGDKESPKGKLFTTSPDETFIVFDAQKGAYGQAAENECMVVETYARPCPAYPQGYFWFWTSEGIFEEGELPFGIWPLAYQPFDKYQTSPRGRSHLKILRPFQAEINRAASKMAEHQTTIGDDKVITQVGTTVTQGNVLPGVRGYQVSGAPPTILPGRDGSQYLPYIQFKITNLYKASLVEELGVEKQVGQMDAYALLARSASQKQKFSIYTERFEQFLADVWTIYFEQARQYMSDEELLEAIGEEERDNIPEFRNPKKLCYILALEAQSEDIESKLGRQLTITQALQYVGNKLEREDIGKLMKNMPFGNFDESFKDLTIDYEIGTNVELALDRGEYPPTHPAHPHKYLIKRLSKRTIDGDFKYLPQPVQQNYARKIQEHTQIEAQQVKQLKAMEADFIPTDGAMITCDMYVPTPDDPTKSKRVRFPYGSLNWLMQRMEQQGNTLGTLEQMHQKNLIEIGRAAGVGQQPQGAPPMAGAPQGAPQVMRPPALPRFS